LQICYNKKIQCKQTLPNSNFLDNKKSLLLSPPQKEAFMIPSLHVLALCGSLRKTSTNMGLLRYARDHAPAGMTIEIADLSPVPFFNQDLEADKPAAVKALLAQFEKADALLIGCTEYNYSMAPVLKNALDWASREKNNRLLAGKPVALMGSGGGMGTSRAQYHFRQTCVYLSLYPLAQPEIFVNAFAPEMFDANGDLLNDPIQKRILQQLEVLAAWVAQLRK
jgi:chromate reductase